MQQPGHAEDAPDGTPPASGVSHELRKQAFRIAAVMAVGLIGLATVVYRSLEGWSWVDSFYFSTIAVTTVGFGDLAPSTDASKLFTVFYVFAGISLVGGVLSERLRRNAARIGERRGR